ncbi:hypothetical protein [Xanthomonas translucens]|uniref:hypothetical protein n=1 Tax=Xanthomonas campestris pv. translucens TaxID=343 RepID=UPI001F625813|nr:hypothetical protein [Xanthomonas translucens]UNU10512.1 hypothetical protein KBV71_14935 [Xanthomonas translucens pv. translucens]
MRRLSPTGLVFCLLYVGVIVWCHWLAQEPQLNLKARMFWRLVPILPPLLALGQLGLMPAFEWLPEVAGYLLMLVLMFWAIYWLGGFLERHIRRSVASRRAAAVYKRGDRGV